MDEVKITPTAEDKRWALDEAMRLLAAYEGGPESFDKHLNALLHEVGQLDVVTRARRSGSLVMMLAAVAGWLARELEDESGMERQAFLTGLERHMEQGLDL